MPATLDNFRGINADTSGPVQGFGPGKALGFCTPFWSFIPAQVGPGTVASLEAKGLIETHNGVGTPEADPDQWRLTAPGLRALADAREHAA
jgi:hypothetical protein